MDLFLKIFWLTGNSKLGYSLTPLYTNLCGGVCLFPEHHPLGELLVGEKLLTFWLALVLDPQRLVEDKPAATSVSAQGRTSGLVSVEFVSKGAGDLHTSIMPHCLHECVLFNQTPIGALYPPHEWRGFTAIGKKLYNDFTVIEAVLCFRGGSGPIFARKLSKLG